MPEETQETRKKMTTEEIKEKYPGLVPFEPGKSGNPKGRTKGSRTFKSVINELIDNDLTIEQAGKQLKIADPKSWLALEMIKIAFNPSETTENRLRAMEKIMERVDGKPEQPLVGDIDKPINLIISDAETRI